MSLAKVTNDPGWVEELAVPVADYAAFYQAVWNPRLMSPDSTYGGFGGFRSQNSDAEWLDMRQNIFAFDYVKLGVELHRQDYIERGVAAMKAGLALITHPRSIANKIFPHPNQPGKNYYPEGIGPENIDHEGLPQLPVRSGPDWGETGALSAAALIMNEIGGAFIDLSTPSAPLSVGVDGVTVAVAASVVSTTTMKLNLDLVSKMTKLIMPWDDAFTVNVVVSGFPEGITTVNALINGKALQLTSNQLANYPVVVSK
jgi:hypothetical protein